MGDKVIDAVVVVLRETNNMHLGFRLDEFGQLPSWSDSEDLNPKQSASLLREIRATAELEGARLRQDVVRREDKSGNKHYFDGGVDTVTTVSEYIGFINAAGVGAFAKAVVDSIFEWKKLNNGRSIVVKVGDVEISVSNPDDLGKAVHLADELGSKVTVKSGTRMSSSAKKRGYKKKA
jgi:hypothetical protein